MGLSTRICPCIGAASSQPVAGVAQHDSLPAEARQHRLPVPILFVNSASNRKPQSTHRHFKVALIQYRLVNITSNTIPLITPSCRLTDRNSQPL
eukprot:1275818-Pyramimonas_sp.AAC.1